MKEGQSLPRIEIDCKGNCSGCSSCMQACPQGCISMQADEEGFIYPEVDDSQCIGCGLCLTSCPFNIRKPNDKQPLAYGGWNNNPKIKENSSSGGIFSAIAQMVIANHGVVFGAAFDQALHLRHQMVAECDDLIMLRGSKYLQSDIGDSYREVQEKVLGGQQVLFSGTPCQVAGLKSFLGHDYDNLITIDLVCHGVPSPQIFRYYKEKLEKEHGSKIINYRFRDKSTGWKQYSIAATFEDGTIYRKKASQDPFIIGFLNNLYLRPSCHECRFGGTRSLADLSLADFWGVQNSHPQLDDDMGISLILVHTTRGKKVIARLGEKVYLQNVDLQKAIASNPCIVKPVPGSRKREIFFSTLSKNGYPYAEKRFLRPPSLIKRIANRLKKVIAG